MAALLLSLAFAIIYVAEPLVVIDSLVGEVGQGMTKSVKPLHFDDKLRPCQLYEDIIGNWVNSSLIKRAIIAHSGKLLSQSEKEASAIKLYGTSSNSTLGPRGDLQPLDVYKSHFYGGGLGEKQALEFSEVWLPDSCSYHRFTNRTFHECAAFNVKRHNATRGDKFHIWVFGDSIMRGVICGLTRILAGSETFGPVNNSICGGWKTTFAKGEDPYMDPASLNHLYNPVSFEVGHI